MPNILAIAHRASPPCLQRRQRGRDDRYREHHWPACVRGEPAIKPFFRKKVYTSDSHNMLSSDNAVAAGAAGLDAFNDCSVPKVLVWSWSSPYVPSGSPAVLAAVLQRIPPGRCEVVCEARYGKRRRSLKFSHPITETRILRCFWPLPVGSRPMQISRYLAVPLLLLYGLYRSWRFRPDCLFTIHFNSVWLLTSYWLSKLTGVPVVYWAHDPYLDSAEFRGGIEGVIARWLAPRSLRHGTVVALYPSLAEHYNRSFGITSRVVRHVLNSYAGNTWQRQHRQGSALVIGFSGTIYDNNRSLIEHLVAAVKHLPDIELRMFTDADKEVQRGLGLPLPNVKVTFLRDPQKLHHELSDCDLLYLPLAFSDTPTLPSASLRYVLPTKAIDYLQTGVEILVHCPSDYETSRFFSECAAAHLLGESGTEHLRKWLIAWRQGQLPAISPAAVALALKEFIPDQNCEKLFGIFRQASGHQELATNASHANPC